VTLGAIALGVSLIACGEKAPTEQRPVKKKMEPVKTTDPREIVRSGFFTPSRNIRCGFASGKKGRCVGAT
jgi:hypothetical protein